MSTIAVQGFFDLEEHELLSVDAGWGWGQTLAVVGAAALIVGAGIVVLASAPIALPAAVAIGTTTGKVIALAGSVTMSAGLYSM